MIRQLLEKDRVQTLNFLSKHPGLNLFQIGDIENYGFDSDIQTVWGSFNENEQLTGVLLRYRENYIPYFEDDYELASQFKQIIMNDSKVKVISGEESIVNHFSDCFEQRKKSEMYFCELVDDQLLQSVDVKVNLATPNDAKRIFDLLVTIEEFETINRISEEPIRRKIEDQSGRVFYIENEDKEVICTVQTTAENSKSAMVVSVATKKGYRRQGLMAQALSHLCKQLLAEGKTLCLFYDNPEAGTVYHKLGFKTIGKWTMLLRK